FSYDVESMKLELSQLYLDVESLNGQISDANATIETIRSDDTMSSAEKDLRIQEQNSLIHGYQYDILKKQTDIDSLKQSIDNCVVLSPISGTVKAINNPNDSSVSSSAFMTITDAGEFTIKAKINELNIQSISVGQEMVIRSRIDETVTWTGTITKIDTSPVSNDNSGEYYYENGQGDAASQYYFYVSPETAEGMLLGQHVTVEAAEGQAPQAEGVLLGSYFICDIDSQPYVWKSENGRLRKAYVTLGSYYEATDEYDVTDGISLEDYIAFPEEGLTEGMKTTTEYVVPEEEYDGTESEEYVIGGSEG
ncbi:MAG: HlyD family efflux transporter periplasmic adaptor subunit, partial [Oscillospiraceae bacterium]